MLLAACLAQEPAAPAARRAVDVSRRRSAAALLQPAARRSGVGPRLHRGDARRQSRADVLHTNHRARATDGCLRHAGVGSARAPRLARAVFVATADQHDARRPAVGELSMSVTRERQAAVDRSGGAGLLRRGRAAALCRSVAARSVAASVAQAGARLVDLRPAAAVAHAARTVFRRRARARRQRVSGDAARRAGDARHAGRLDRRVARRRGRDRDRLASRARRVRHLGRRARRRGGRPGVGRRGGHAEARRVGVRPAARRRRHQQRLLGTDPPDSRPVGTVAVVRHFALADRQPRRDRLPRARDVRRRVVIVAAILVVRRARQWNLLAVGEAWAGTRGGDVRRLASLRLRRRLVPRGVDGRVDRADRLHRPRRAASRPRTDQRRRSRPDAVRVLLRRRAAGVVRRGGPRGPRAGRSAGRRDHRVHRRTVSHVAAAQART